MDKIFLFLRILFSFDAYRLNLNAGRGIIASGRRKYRDASGRNIDAGRRNLMGPRMIGPRPYAAALAQNAQGPLEVRGVGHMGLLQPGASLTRI